MSHNSFGHLFRVTTFGESHGAGIGCVVDGCPPRIPLEAADIQAELDRRRPGTSRFTTQRREPDEARILSGVMVDERCGRQMTTGTPIGVFIENVDQRSKDYGEIRDKYRPGHADYAYDAKYGIRDYRGGGRSSARETAARVAAGAIARKVIPGVHDPRRAGADRTAEDRPARWDWDEIGRNPFFCPDAARGGAFRRLSRRHPQGGLVGWRGDRDRRRGRSRRLGRADLRQARRGTGERADERQCGQGRRDRRRLRRGRTHRRGERRRNAPGPGWAAELLSNHAGGILGGISTGQPVVARFAVKPTSSILSPRRTITRAFEETEIVTKGRHDPCVGIRAVPVGEAMAACVLADAFLRHRGQVGDPVYGLALVALRDGVHLCVASVV